MTNSWTRLVALTTGLALVACSDPEPVPTMVGTVAQLSTSDGVLPLPNDLLFSGSIDGTLNAPNPSALDAFDSLNALDGWSTLAPISIPFSAALDATTVTGQPPLVGSAATVRVFQVSLTGIGGAVTSIDAELTQGVDYLASLAPDGRNVAVLPLRPLEAATSYLVIATNGIRDTGGAAVGRSIVYDLAAGEAEQEDPDLASLQALVGAMLTAVEGQGVDPNSVVMSFTFTTQSIGASLQAVSQYVAGDFAEDALLEGLLGANPALLFPADDPTGNVDDKADPANTATIGNFASVVGETGLDVPAGTIDVLQGELTIPSYVETSAPDDPTSSTGLSFLDQTSLSTNWQSRFEFAVPGETDRHVTGLNSAPVVRTTETIPVLVTVPDDGSAQPVGGWPVVVYLHGLSSNRSTLLGIKADQAATVDVAGSIAGTMAAQDFVCVAIDQPLHGIAFGDPFGDSQLFVGYGTTDTIGPGPGALRERTFGLDLINNATSAPGPDGVADPSGTHFFNLASLRSVRDHIGQGIADLLWLTSVLDQIDLDGDTNPDLDTSNVHFIGHSGGGVLGLPYLRYAPFSGLAVQSGVLGQAGGGIAELLANSPSFGPIVQAGVAAGAGITTGDPSFPAVLAQFLFAAQSALDTIDPLNHAAGYASTFTGGLPPTASLLLLEVEGEDGVNDPDQTVPNNVPISGTPFFLPAGTDPLVAALGATTATTTTGNLSGASADLAHVRTSRGTHSSFISPVVPIPVGVTAIDLQDAFDDQQALLEEYVTSDGTTVTITGLPTVITTEP